MRNHTRLAAVGVLTVAGCLLSACSTGSSGSADLTQAAAGSSATGSHVSAAATAAGGNLLRGPPPALTRRPPRRRLLRMGLPG
jgi:hypothetical protein